MLKAAGIRVYTWREGDLPTLAEVRSTMAAELAPAQAETKATSSRPMPLIPVADIEEVLAEGDQFSYDTALEPVPSGFYDEEVDSVRGQLAAQLIQPSSACANSRASKVCRSSTFSPTPMK